MEVPMYIYTATQLKQIDVHTIRQQKISSWDLMERAALALAQQLKTLFPDTKRPIAIICGKGNNGGDGLAIARLLQEAKYQVKVCLLEAPEYTADNLQNQERLKALDIPVHIFGKEDALDIPEDSLVLDCLFGSGLHAPLDASWRAVIAQINRCAQIIAIDLPSGLSADAHTPGDAPVVQARYTFTLQAPKMALLLPENEARVGEVHILDIQLDDTCLDREVLPAQYIGKALVQAMYKPRKQYAHKGTFGHSLLIGGSYGKVGSVLLSAKAALRSGTGLVSLYAPACAYTIVQSAFPEAMVLTDPGDHYLVGFPEPQSFRAIGLGMGMGQHSETAVAFLDWLQEYKDQLPALVIDADGLNILATHNTGLEMLPAGTILSPYPKELQRLIGDWDHDFDKIEKAKALAKRYQLVLLIKGAHTIVVMPDGKLYVNSSGNPGMATAGSGDVLSGILTGLRAQGYTAAEAAIMGVWLHGLAGDMAALDLGVEALIAGDLIQYLSKAFMTFR